MLEKYGVITGVMPIAEGWRFLQELPQGGVQRIPARGCAGTDASLVEQVKLFRVNAGIDLGDVAGDVAAYIKRVSPINDRFPGRTPKVDTRTEGQNGFRPYIERIRDWLLQVSNRQVRLLIEDEADARAEVCMKCPHNVKWVTGCVPCCEAVVSRGQNVRQRPSYKHDDALGACRLHDLKISTAVFIDREDLPDLNPNAPDFCWMRNAA